MKRFVVAIAVTLVASTASAAVPLFAAKCGQGITADSNAQGQVRVNGKIAKLINRPDGQVTAQSGGVYVDITPQGNQPPRITYTGRDKSTGECEILSFAPPAGHSAAARNHASPGDYPAKLGFPAGNARACGITFPGRTSAAPVRGERRPSGP